MITVMQILSLRHLGTCPHPVSVPVKQPRNAPLDTMATGQRAHRAHHPPIIMFITMQH